MAEKARLPKSGNRGLLSALAGELGFEPRLTESESAVLPLNYSPIFSKPCSVEAAGSELMLKEGLIRLTRYYLAKLFFSCQPILFSPLCVEIYPKSQWDLLRRGDSFIPPSAEGGNRPRAGRHESREAVRPL